MASWLPGQASTVSNGEELAAAPPFEGEIVKPSTKATPYPTTSTPQGYVVPGETETPEATQVAATPPAIDITDPATGRTPPVTYGMKPVEAATIAGTDAAASPSPFGGAEQQPPAESIAAQEGPYAPITPAGQPEAPPQTVASGFSAAGGTSTGLYPPEQEAGLPPPAGETASYAQSGGSAFGGGMAPADAPAAEAGQSSSAFAATPPPTGSSFASQPVAPAGGGSAFSSPEAYAPPAAATASAFGQPATVPEGAASDSPVASSRYASAGTSRFGGGGVSEPAGFAASAAEEPAGEAAPWQPTPAEVSIEPAGQPSAYAAAGSSFATPPAERSFDEPVGAAATGLGDQPAGFDAQASQPSSPDAGRPQRRPDPMYRPAGTSSYRPSEPIFSDEPSSNGPVQMATFEEPASLPPPQQ